MDDFNFWPDLASAHYAKHTVELFNELKIPYVSKDQNPPNVPQCRPIQNFWVVLKYKVYESGGEATNILQLKRKISKVLKDMDLYFLQRDFSQLKKKLRKVSRNGPLSII